MHTVPEDKTAFNPNLIFLSQNLVFQDTLQPCPDFLKYSKQIFREK
ncbi:hypothetical protein Dm11a5_1537 [Dehalococcoides mccartyi]|uniref:Uncharacterized protein n=1 Tax=Dehalococcoides mccartyi TaxID=61435 RepID=A0A142VBZ9_9CHLR|nr:hypothetical protein Dm11a5_1537 [Dehalococcoides mccartyi]AOW00007.1 hypothetical protein DCWBC2_1399 [Dehalococcoides mccartyi]